MPTTGISRRAAMQMMGAGLMALSLPPSLAFARPSEVVKKAIPRTSEELPVIGMGTWRTFNVGRDQALRDARTEVLRAFFEHGGGMIDNSPMYGSAQPVLGEGLAKLGMPETLFSADKVWTQDEDATRRQIAESQRLWGVERFDLMKVHNLVAWEAHLDVLKRMKADGEVRYIGISTSHGRRHDQCAHIMENHDIDFIQLTYNITHRDVEQRLLPLAAERDIAVVANRPFDGGRFVKNLKANHPLPAWAREIDCDHWPAFLLKFIVSHPAVTCAIPATTQVEHMHENMAAGRGAMPDADTRRRMIDYVASL
jgi:diketogulonate reductase-like aldo/keto reductase